MKNILLNISILFCLSIPVSVFALDGEFTETSLVLDDETGCVATTYTFKQKVPNDKDLKITTSNTVTITFPTGIDASTFTSGTFSGSAITGATATTSTITFTVPKAVGQNKSFDIVLNGITNGADIDDSASVVVTNNSGGIDYYYDYLVSTGACPTCSDGIQNGTETGIDCGGDSCAACPTCSDGIQNGNETGVDCGGDSCSACPTCSDGIQNGTETGVDCGGVCAACPTCTDGIQNGDETGIDCGGSCPVSVCPTCSDGIQNGNEEGVDCGGDSCAACVENSDLYNVIMNNTGTGVNMLSDMITHEGGTVTLNDGLIHTYAYEVKVKNPDVNSVTNHTIDSYVDGNLRRLLNPTGSYDFPVGNLTHEYQLVNINFTTATEINDLVARFDDWAPLAPPLNEVECNWIYNYDPLDNGYWTITADTLDTTGVYTATLFNTNYTNAISDTITIMRDGGSGWELRNGDSCRLNSPDTVIRENMYGFSYFANAQGGAFSALPADQMKFHGQAHRSYNHLVWVANTDNLDHFEILKSTNGKSFESIGAIKDSKGDYYFNDYSLKSEVNYYRIKKVTTQGKMLFSEIVKLKSEFDDYNLGIYPNPSNGIFNISLTLNSQNYHDKAHIEVVNSIGQVVYDTRVETNIGMNSFVLDLEGLGSDLYFLKIKVGSSTVGNKLIIEK